MPWQTSTEMSLRYNFIAACEKRDLSMSGLCREFGISRKTGHKWWRRFQACGYDGLVDQRSNRPKRAELYTEDVWRLIFSCRIENPTYGPRKIVKMLCNQHRDIQWPSISLVKKRLKEEGLSVPRLCRRKIVTERLPLRKIDAPNAVWSIDFKGWFTSRDGKRCEPLTLMDGYSRYLLLCELVPRTNYQTVKPLLERAFREYGKPEAIRSDNGPPFGSNGLRGLSPLSVWLLKQGIWPEKITPGNPGQNGRVERLHRTLKADALKHPGKYDEYPERLKVFVTKYNTLRPHEALNDQPPVSAYTKSTRQYHPEEAEEYSYPTGYRVYRVDSHGYLRLPGARLYISESLAREHVGVNSKDEEEPILFLGYPLGTIREHQERGHS